ncbi:MAG: hypothetical protein G01um101424_223 [Parcubacteria group bacterium Gr01-1014_24]|nr:MAG: hypothetical protein G01um101424_223 [Parcubacteria group bacterium Gr01-1014_24]
MNKGDSPVFILVIVLILVIYGFWLVKKNPVPTYTNQPTDSVENANDGSVNVTFPATSISYAQALVKYKDARLQLDQECRATPANVTYKNNTNIMIDNRAPISRAVKVGSVFSIKAYGFKIVKLSSLTLPATWYVDCDKSQNVAAILIQK